MALFEHASTCDPASGAWCCDQPDLLRRARERVRAVGWLTLVTMGVGGTVDLVYSWVVMDTWVPAWLILFLGVVVASAGIIVAARDHRVDDVTVLRLGLAFEVALCLVVATITPWRMYLDTGMLPYVTWVTPIIILFPLLVPSPPRITILAATAAAATRPLGLLILHHGIGLEVGALAYAMSLLSPAIAVPLAYVGSRIVHGMAREVVKARRMGSYQLVSQLGRGGMGEVWLARHRFLARPAAVKLVRAEVLTDRSDERQALLARFEREAQATATLNSPHTVALYDFGVSEDGDLFYVMELLDGVDLHVLVTRFGALSPARALYILLQICDSIGEAHDRGLIHRDIKPANVYVCRKWRQADFVKVLDFGLVKVAGADHREDHGITKAGAVRGTPNFIAPEQARGEDADARSDIYAIGCVAFWLLTGSYVFEGRTLLHTLMLHGTAEADPPSSRTTQPIPRAVDDVVLACLEKDPARRPQSADELASRLRACPVGEPWSAAKACEWWETFLPELTPERSAAAPVATAYDRTVPDAGKRLLRV